MSDNRHCVLTEAIISVRQSGKRVKLTLPGALAALGGVEPVEFPVLRAHQTHAWHSFLVQLAAMGMHQDGISEFARSEEEWRECLRRLGKGDEAWSLVVGDLSKPALFQPPVPEGSLAGFNQVEFPDELDMLITSKNHDVKRTRIASPAAEHWLYALLTMQTMSGYSGAKTYGIARMNGGSSSRPAIGIGPGLDWGSRVRKDVGVSLQCRDELISSFQFRPSDGAGLLWLEAWDGTSPRSLEELDPFFIEICRRVRLQALPTGRLIANRRGTAAKRTDCDQQKGNVGDMWAPVRRKDAAAMTASAEGFSYKRLQEVLLGGEYAPPRAMKQTAEDGECPVVVARVLVGGNCVTEGYHERVLPMSRKVAFAFRTRERLEELAELSRDWVDRVASIRTELLRRSLCILLQGASPNIDWKDKGAEPWSKRLDDAVDRVFFQRLWESLEEPGPLANATDRFTLEVLAMAQHILEQAIDSVPMPSARKYSAIAHAERYFNGIKYKKYGDIINKEKSNESN